MKKIDTGVAICYLDGNSSELFHDGVTAASLDGSMGQWMTDIPSYRYSHKGGGYDLSDTSNIPNLILTVGLDYKTLCDRFENMEPEHEGKWGDEDDMDKEASFANLVRDRDDDDKFAILWNFSSDDDLIMRNICHESFHIAMSVCQFCNMSLGFKVGEDEHAAYIAGFAGDCVSEFINSKNTD